MTTSTAQIPAAVETPSRNLRRGRILQLDVLRGIAILMVLWFHPVIPPERAGLFWPVADVGHRIGWSGVDLFFVLSGFLIGGLLFKEIATYGKLNVLRFWIRRGLKIWPGYYALLFLVFTESMLHHHGLHESVIALVPNLLHLQNYFRPVRPQTWSLAVEEHFYIALPALLLLLPLRKREGRTSIPALAPIVVCVAIVVMLLRSYMEVYHPGYRADRTHLNIDGMLFGVFLAYLKQFENERFLRLTTLPFLPGIAALLLATNYFNIFFPVWAVGLTHSTLYLGYGLMLIYIVHTPLHQGLMGKALASPPARLLAFIGFYSYAIYLWYWEIFAAMYYQFEHHLSHVPESLLWPAAMVAYFGLSVAAGVLMAGIIELPVLALRNRWFPARAVITEKES